MTRSPLLVSAVAAAVCGLPPAAAGQSDDPVLRDRKRSEWVERLKHDDAKARAEAAGMIGAMERFAGPAGRDLAAALGTEKDARVRGEIADALGRIADPDVAVPALSAAVKDADPAVSSRAARALANYGPKAAAAAPLLTARSKGQDEVEAMSAAVALTRIDPTRDDGVRTLVALARNAKDETVREFALSGLAIELGEPGLLKRHAALAVPLFVELLKDDRKPGEDTTANRRMTAADGLGFLGPAAKDAVPALAAALADRNAFVRLAAAHALFRIDPKNPNVTRAIVAAIKEEDRLFPDRFNTMDAVRLAGELGPAAKDAVPELIALWKAPKLHVQVRQSITYALGQIGPDAKAALPLLTPDLKAADPSARFDAAHAVSRIDPKNAEAVAIVKSIALDPGADVWIDLRMMALEALTEIPSERAAAIRAATAALRDPGQFEKRGGLQIGGGRLVIKRTELLTSVKYMSAGIVGGLGADAKDAVPVLVAALKDRHVEVRLAAAGALEKLDPEALRNAGAK